MSRTTWSMADEAAHRLEDVADRQEEESATQFIRRVADELEAAQAEDVTERNAPDDVLTPDHIDDIAARTAVQTRRELEEMRF